MSDIEDGFVPNPVLAGLVGICPLAVAARSLAEGVVYGLGAAFCALTLGAFVPPLRGLIADRLQAPANLALSAILALVFGFCVGVYSPTISAGLWIYLPLLAVSGLSLSVLRRSSGSRAGRESGSRLGRIALEAFWFLLTASFIGGLREVVGLGTLTLPGPGLAPARVVAFDLAPMRLLVSPAGGFMILGFLVAAYRSTLGAAGRTAR
jgi:Na+-translocating ferredoxin:NAD+ oxidoreductase subunit E